jgi:hypothetical protein
VTWSSRSTVFVGTLTVGSLSSVEKMKNMDYPAEKDVAERTIDTEDGIWYETLSNETVLRGPLLETKEI